MIAFDPNSACEQAKAHYYEYLFGDTKKCVSTHMHGHIDGCSSCQAEVRRLKVILAEGEGNTAGDDSEKTAAITTYLRFHFVYLRAFVDCKTLKLFLPTLAIPALQVSIPTPITVHLDNCQQCTEDLEAIRRLKLTSKQLGRLGQLLAEEPGTDTHICSEARNKIASVGAMVFKDASPEILRHLCVCPECRKLLYEDRNNRIEKLALNSNQSPMPCDAVSPADLFDYVIPFGIEPDHDPHVMFRKSLTSHLINCPRCLDRMQKLHDTVYSVFERHESGIVTRYNIRESGRESTVDGSDGLYKDWPIEVQVFDNSEETQTVETGALEDVTASVEPETKRKFSFLRPFIKPAMAAAAVILIALLFNIPAARAVNLSQISKALEGIKNVCITTFYQNESNKTQEVWISRTLNIKMQKTGNKCTLWDLNAKSEKSKNLNTGSIEITKLEDALLLNIKKTMEGPMTLLPFNSMPEAPEGAKWLPVANENTDTDISAEEKYDLIWTDKKSGIYNKWRAYVEKKLPTRIEWWEKKRAEEDYELLTIIRLDYLSTTKVQAAIRDAGF